MKEKELYEEKKRREIFKKYLEFIASGTSVLKDFYSPIIQKFLQLKFNKLLNNDLNFKD